MNPTASSHPVTRRAFLQRASLASAATVAFPAILRSQPGQPSPNNRLNVACIGLGSQGRNVVNAMKGENLVAFCDVDDAHAARVYDAHPEVPRFRDYRVLLEKLGDRIDAVAIATPDHMHYPIAVAALQLGKHVFLEKPLTHTIAEARQLARLAQEKKVATQMGNQGRATESIRLYKEGVDAGVLGDVREVHAWTNRPLSHWPQGRLAVRPPDHSKMIPVCPPTLDWDLWLGVAPARPYDPMFAPFKWRGFWDFGTGAMGDMGCHIIDGAFWALQLGAPRTVEAVGAFQNDLTGPSAAMVVFEFPARGALPPLTLKWFEGGLTPALPGDWETGRELPDNGTLTFGSKATVLTASHFQNLRIVPETRMRELAPNLPAKTIPRIEGDHFAEWIRACKGGPAAGSNFDYAAGLTELCLLSNLAVRVRRKLEWDSVAGRVTNVPEANQYLTKTYRPGFGV